MKKWDLNIKIFKCPNITSYYKFKENSLIFNMRNDFESLHFDILRLLRRNSRQELCQDVMEKINNSEHECKVKNYFLFKNSKEIPIDHNKNCLNRILKLLC